MGIGEFIKNVICAQYSIPVGIINSNVKEPISFCTTTLNKELNVEDVSDANRSFSGSVGNSDGLISSESEYEILNENVKKILRNVQTKSEIAVTTDQTATIKCRIGFTGECFEWGKCECRDGEENCPDNKRSVSGKPLHDIRKEIRAEYIGYSDEEKKENHKKTIDKLKGLSEKHKTACTATPGAIWKDYICKTQEEWFNPEIVDSEYQNMLTGSRNYDHSDVDCANDYQDVPSCAYRLTKKYKGRDGKFYNVPVYGCCPSVDQEANISVDTYEKVTTNDYDAIANEIQLSVSNTLNLQGSSEEANTAVDVVSSNDIKNQLIVNIEENITSTTRQNLSVSQGLVYTDRYGMCDQIIDENGRPRSVGKRLKQMIDIDVLSKNIINSSIDIIMENTVDVISSTTVTVQRITNYRIIVCSLVLNVVIIYLLLKILSLVI